MPRLNFAFYFFFSLVLGLGLLGQPLLAQTGYFYRYQENGQWHFSDQAPKATATGLEKISTPAQGFLAIEWQDANTLRLYNKSYAPLEVLLKKLRQQTFLIPARSRLVIDYLSYIPDLQANYVFGDPGATPDGFLYQLPYPKGQGFLITQGFAGSFSHYTPESLFAVDFAMPEGTPVCMARSGVVVAVSSHYTLAQTDDFYKTRSNHLLVLHTDGTFALYGHLKPGSVLVRPGTKVKTGDCVARSGNTGFSTGPHLHFVVQRNAGMAYQAIAIDFADQEGRPQIPATGIVLKH